MHSVLLSLEAQSSPASALCSFPIKASYEVLDNFFSNSDKCGAINDEAFWCLDMAPTQKVQSGNEIDASIFSIKPLLHVRHSLAG